MPSLQCTWCIEGAWAPDLSGVLSSACNWVISSVLSPLRKGFLDLFVLAVALASTSENSISWIPRSPRRKPSNTNGSSSHFRTGVGRELPHALKISLSNNFHIKYVSYPSLLLPELAKPVSNPDSFKMFRFSHPALIVCSISSSAQFRLCVNSKAHQLAAPRGRSKCSSVKASSAWQKEIQICYQLNESLKPEDSISMGSVPALGLEHHSDIVSVLFRQQT